MKPSDGKTIDVPIPFFDNGKLKVFTLHEKNKILGWQVDDKKFLVRKGTILEAWKKTEKYINSKL